LSLLGKIPMLRLRLKIWERGREISLHKNLTILLRHPLRRNYFLAEDF
jgi:hypothetical protein